MSDDPKITDLQERYGREMTRRGLPNSWPALNIYDYSALYLDDEPISTILFARLKKDQNIYVSGAYTKPSWRRLGIYSFVVRQSVNLWRLEGNNDFLMSGFHKDNLSSRIMQEKQGREIILKPQGDYMSRLSLKPTGEEWAMDASVMEPMVRLINRIKA
jgi:hypothetical protein